MALIKCPECGKEVSDKSKVCIHCGYPYLSVDESVIIINGEEYPNDIFKKLLDNSEFKNQVEVIQFLIANTHCSLSDARLVANRIIETGEIPKSLELKVKPQEVKAFNQIKCPTCSSTNVKRISETAKIAGALSFGIFSTTAKSQFKCENCGYKW